MQLLRFLIFTGFIFVSSCKVHQQRHYNATVVDTHNDFLSGGAMNGFQIENDLRGKTHSDLRRFRQGGVDVQVFSVFCDERFGHDTAFKYANIQIDSFYKIVGRNPDLIMVSDTASLATAIRSKKLGCMIGVEGGHMIEENLLNLDRFYERGVRYLTITWNNSVSWASSAKDEAAGTVTQKGLNAFGRQVIRRMNELGMMVDVSHAGEKTFWDILETTNKPIIASHSSAYSLCPHPRNLTDEQIRAIGRNGGVVHVNFYSGFIDSTYAKRKEAFIARHSRERDSLLALNATSYSIDEVISRKYPAEANALRPTLSQLVDHIDHIVRLAGIDHVGLGSDYDGIESSPLQLDDVSSFPNITRELMRRGYSQSDLKKILGENFIRVFSLNQRKEW